MQYFSQVDLMIRNLEKFIWTDLEQIWVVKHFPNHFHFQIIKEKRKINFLIANGPAQRDQPASYGLSARERTREDRRAARFGLRPKAFLAQLGRGDGPCRCGWPRGPTQRPESRGGAPLPAFSPVARFPVKQAALGDSLWQGGGEGGRMEAGKAPWQGSGGRRRAWANGVRRWMKSIHREGRKVRQSA
jgi:hypothetical protein